MHVAIMGHTAVLSGAELALIRILPYLESDEVEITVVLAENGPLALAAKNAGIRVSILPLDPRIRSARREDTRSLRRAIRAVPPMAIYVRALRAFLKDNRVDVVHTNTLKSAVYGGLAGRAARVPVLWHIRDRIADNYLPPSTTRLIRQAARIIPDQIAVNSATTAATLPQSVQSRVSMVPDCVEVPVGPIRERWQHDAPHHDRVVLGMMGRLANWKGQHIALEAFAQAFADNPSVELRFVGSAMFGEEAYEERLASRTRQLGLDDRVSFRGFRDDIWTEYASFDVAIHASVLPEPFGQVVIEAMAAELPVVAAAEGGPAEVVRDGWNGLLVPPGDIESLAAALTTLVREPALREKLAHNGRATAEFYTPEATVAALRDIYHGLHRSRDEGQT